MDTDLLIVGGGLVGCATAWHMAMAGAAPLLIEARSLNAGASGQNAGSLHFQIERRFLENGETQAAQAAQIVSLSRLAIEEWRSLEQRLGSPLDIAMHGGLMVAESSDELALLKNKVARERELGLQTRLLDQDEVRSIAPFLSRQVQAAAFLADEGHANPRILTDAFAAGARAAGATIRTGTRLVALRMKRANRFVATIDDGAVRTEISCGAVLLAAGAWTPWLASMLGLHIPLFAVPLTMNVTERTGPFLPYLIQHVGKRLSMKQSEDGNIVIGGGWPSRFAHNGTGAIDLDRRAIADAGQIRANLAVAAAILPRVAKLCLIRSWTGITCNSADQLPIVGMVDAAPGLYVAAGGSMFTLGPVVARLLAEQIGRGGTPACETALFSPRRFNHLNASALLS